MEQESPPNELQVLLQQALDARRDMLASGDSNAIRLFSGFYEGCSDLAVDLYDRTLILFDHRDDPKNPPSWIEEIQRFYLDRLPQINCVVRKVRNSPDPAQRKGILSGEGTPADRVNEWGIQYALDLMLNQDSSFYPDMRNLRRWLLENSRDCDVLNTFAYTGSLGVAALAGGARSVLQTDRNHAFLALARTSCMLNRLDLGKMKLQTGDFFTQMSQLRRQGDLFDLVVLDPPFFSVSRQGVVDQQEAGWRLINKVRPLVSDGGRIVAVNNSLYLSGEAYIRSLQDLCAGGYMQVEQIIPVPADVTGTPATIRSKPPVPAEPFNHPTKIVVLRVRRK